MQGMDTYHGSHGKSSGYESRVGLFIPLVSLSSLDGVPDEDTFFRHTFFVAGLASISFFCFFIGSSVLRSYGCAP